MIDKAREAREIQASKSITAAGEAAMALTMIEVAIRQAMEASK